MIEGVVEKLVGQPAEADRAGVNAGDNGALAGGVGSSAASSAWARTRRPGCGAGARRRRSGCA